MKTLQLSNLKYPQKTKDYMNVLGHTCVSYQQEKIYILSQCHLRLVPPNVNTPLAAESKLGGKSKETG